MLRAENENQYLKLQFLYSVQSVRQCCQRFPWPKYQEIRESVRKVKTPSQVNLGFNTAGTHSQQTTGRAGIRETLGNQQQGRSNWKENSQYPKHLKLTPFTFLFIVLSVSPYYVRLPDSQPISPQPIGSQIKHSESYFTTKDINQLWLKFRHKMEEEMD